MKKNDYQVLVTRAAIVTYVNLWGLDYRDYNREGKKDEQKNDEYCSDSIVGL